MENEVKVFNDIYLAVLAFHFSVIDICEGIFFLTMHIFLLSAKKNGGNTGVIIGAVVGAIVVILIIVGVIWYCKRRSKWD